MFLISLYKTLWLWPLCVRMILQSSILDVSSHKRNSHKRMENFFADVECELNVSYTVRTRIQTICSDNCVRVAGTSQTCPTVHQNCIRHIRPTTFGVSEKLSDNQSSFVSCLNDKYRRAHTTSTIKTC